MWTKSNEILLLAKDLEKQVDEKLDPMIEFSRKIIITNSLFQNYNLKYGKSLNKNLRNHLP